MTVRRRTPQRSSRSFRPLGTRRAPLPRISESLLRFAEPLLKMMPDPPSERDMQSAMALATIAWNLPMLEGQGDGEDLKQMYDSLIVRVEPLIRAALRGMLEARSEHWGYDRRLVSEVEVVECGGELSVHAVATAAL